FPGGTFTWAGFSAGSRGWHHNSEKPKVLGRTYEIDSIIPPRSMATAPSTGSKSQNRNETTAEPNGHRPWWRRRATSATNVSRGSYKGGQSRYLLSNFALPPLRQSTGTKVRAGTMVRHLRVMSHHDPWLNPYEFARQSSIHAGRRRYFVFSTQGLV